MIEEFEDGASPRHVETVVRAYGLTLAHKHVPEMQKHSGLAHPPLFAPTVGRFYRGMIVEVPLQLWALPTKPPVFELLRVLGETYRGANLIEVAGFDAAIEALAARLEKRAIDPQSLEQMVSPQSLDVEMLRLTNGMKLFVFGNDKTHQARLVAVLDNLGKGASGAAVQNLNIMLGLPETTGLL